jgi:hypothetical protein
MSPKPDNLKCGADAMLAYPSFRTKSSNFSRQINPYSYMLQWDNAPKDADCPFSFMFPPSGVRGTDLAFRQNETENLFPSAKQRQNNFVLKLRRQQRPISL